MATKRSPQTQAAPQPRQRRYAVVGAGMAGIACARTLQQAGHLVTVVEAQPQVGGRMASYRGSHGSFDIGAQFFTVRDTRLQMALNTTPEATRHWSANAIRTLDATGRVALATQAGLEPHMVGVPTMDSLLQAWAAPLDVRLGEVVTFIECDAITPAQWQLNCEDADGGTHIHAGLDGVVLAIPAPEAQELLTASDIATPESWPLSDVYIAPSYTLLLTFAHAVDPQLAAIGPQWNAARTEHPRISWLARESSKPGRSKIERWTVQASPDWASKHQGEDMERIAAKMQQAFAELTRIYAQPSETHIIAWPYAKTINPLPTDKRGQPRSYLWDASSGIGLCGDWCLGYRAEDAFTSGLELALEIVG